MALIAGSAVLVYAVYNNNIGKETEENNDNFDVVRPWWHLPNLLPMPSIYAASKMSFPADVSQNRERYNFIADVVEISAPSVVYIEIKDQKR